MTTFIFICILLGFIISIIFWIMFFRMMININQIKNFLNNDFRAYLKEQKKKSEENPISFKEIRYMALAGETEEAYKLVVKRGAKILDHFIKKYNIYPNSDEKYFQIGNNSIKEIQSFCELLNKKPPMELLSFENYLEYYYSSIRRFKNQPGNA